MNISLMRGGQYLYSWGIGSYSAVGFTVYAPQIHDSACKHSNGQLGAGYNRWLIRESTSRYFCRSTASFTLGKTLNGGYMRHPLDHGPASSTSDSKEAPRKHRE